MGGIPKEQWKYWVSTGSTTVYLGSYFRFSDSHFSSSCRTHKYCCLVHTDLLSCDFLHENPSLTTPLLAWLHRSCGLWAAVIQLKFPVFSMAHNTGDFQCWALAVQLELNTPDRHCWQCPAMQEADAKVIFFRSVSHTNHLLPVVS